MERLTRVIKGYGNDVIVYTQGKHTDTTAGEMEYKDVRNVMKHLCDYENTGLTPQEIMELKERDTAKAPNKKLRHRGGFETFHCPNCDTSYQMDRRYTITDEYCPKCGKLLDSSFRSFCANCGQRLEEGR